MSQYPGGTGPWSAPGGEGGHGQGGQGQQWPAGQAPWAQPPPYGSSPQGAPPPQYGQPSYGPQPSYGSQPPHPQPSYGAPQYGTPQGPSQWHQLPPEDLIRLHRPGVVPLRPLSLGDIFGGSLTTMRRNPEATIGMALVVLAVFLVPSLALALGLRTLTSLAVTDWAALGLLLPALASSVATLALSGFIIYVVSEAALGERVGIGQTWRAVRGRLPALIGVTLLTGLIFLGVVVGVVLLIAAAVAVADAAGAVLGVLLVLGLIPLLLWLLARVALGSAAVVLERAGPGRGIGRAWQLTSGRQAWRVLGILILAGILAGIFSTAVSLPLGLAADALLLVVTEDVDVQLTGTVVLQHLLQLVINAVATPFTAGVTALLYLDQRMRREGLDVTLIQAAQERAAARRS